MGFERSMPDEQPSVQVHHLHREGAQGVQRADSKHLQAEVHSAEGVLQAPEPRTPHRPLKLLVHLEPEIHQHPLLCLLVHYEASPNILQADHELPAVPHGEDPHITSRQYIPQQKK